MALFSNYRAANPSNLNYIPFSGLIGITASRIMSPSFIARSDENDVASLAKRHPMTIIEVFPFFFLSFFFS